MPPELRKRNEDGRALLPSADEKMTAVATEPRTQKKKMDKDISKAVSGDIAGPTAQASPAPRGRGRPKKVSKGATKTSAGSGFDAGLEPEGADSGYRGDVSVMSQDGGLGTESKEFQTTDNAHTRSGISSSRLDDKSPREAIRVSSSSSHHPSQHSSGESRKWWILIALCLTCLLYLAVLFRQNTTPTETTGNGRNESGGRSDAPLVDDITYHVGPDGRSLERKVKKGKDPWAGDRLPRKKVV
ncbi:Hypothetical predicted protein [Lecanosticta acicola]|uniref:Uncharacterized protein n=1 Tax=Lecanosticta acicola TaxID=111012 RepID=A0AAI8Z897_9PEZI|nr:Hypothetical predicted protein [Lecanosticta acicola]